MIRFTLFGIPIVVQPFFWLTLAIIGALGNQQALGGSSPEALLNIALFVLAGFISILVHELGHALVARKFGAQVQIVLQAFGGYASYTGARIDRLRSICISAAGPAFQLALGMVVILLARQMPNLQLPAKYFLWVLLMISVIWSLFNLLPILPLDGGRIVQAALGPKRIRITLWVTILTAAVVGILAMVYTRSIIAPIFLGFMAWQAWKALQQVPPWR